MVPTPSQFPTLNHPAGCPACLGVVLGIPKSAKSQAAPHYPILTLDPWPGWQNQQEEPDGPWLLRRGLMPSPKISCASFSLSPPPSIHCQEPAALSIPAPSNRRQWWTLESWTRTEGGAVDPSILPLSGPWLRLDLTSGCTGGS